MTRNCDRTCQKPDNDLFLKPTEVLFLQKAMNVCKKGKTNLIESCGLKLYNKRRTQPKQNYFSQAYFFTGFMYIRLGTRNIFFQIKVSRRHLMSLSEIPPHPRIHHFFSCIHGRGMKREAKCLF